ncbi:MAG: 50S ribosome-binding GTPase [Phycisphaerales bacterium]|nr:50S ribosome-binding GTPase [Phycisphaerales bacterium]
MSVSRSIQTPRHAPGAIAVVRLAGEDLDNCLRGLGLGPAPVGSARLVDILGVDRGLVVRWSPGVADLCVHGGLGVLDALDARLREHGLSEQTELDWRNETNWRAAWPEARDEIEARMLEALSQAVSPRAVDALLAQPARWRARRQGDLLADGTVLRRLLHAPLVVIWGAPNIGKSTLLNALAREQVGLVADMPGTTRDAVGATVLLDGLAVRMLDAPGIAAGGAGSEPDPLVADAVSIARELVAEADLVLCCGDATHEPLPIEQAHLRVALRADAATPAWSHDALVSGHTGQGLSALALLIRQTLVPDAAMKDERAWKFWE